MNKVDIPDERAAQDRLGACAQTFTRVREGLNAVIFGQEDVIEQTLITLLAGGHGLLIGVPGLAKTKLVDSLGTVLGLDTSRVRSNRFRPLMKQFFWGFVVACLLLGYCGGQSVDAVKFGVPMVWVARVASLYYYAFFWLIMPIVGLIETPKKLPASIAQSVLGDSAAAAAE